MGRLAYLAEQHYRRYLPHAYADITDREAFFRELEDQAEAQIQELEDALAGPDVPGEEFWDKAGRLRMARHQAEEIVLPELILITPEDAASDDAASERYDPDTGIPLPPPEDEELAAAPRDFAEARDEFEGSAVTSSARPEGSGR